MLGHKGIMPSFLELEGKIHSITIYVMILISNGIEKKKNSVFFDVDSNKLVLNKMEQLNT